jgi:hypothetical protein
MPVYTGVAEVVIGSALSIKNEKMWRGKKEEI